jgi:hypothetical protein
MFLLSPEILKILEIYVKLGTFFRVIPYQWDETRKCIVLTPKKQQFHDQIFSWETVSCLSFLHLIFVLVRLWQSISGQRHYFAFYIIQCTYALTFVLASLIQALLIQNKMDILLFTNRFLQFAQTIERK